MSFLNAATEKPGHIIETAFPKSPKNAVPLGQVFSNHLALSFGLARDQDAAVPLP